MSIIMSKNIEPLSEFRKNSADFIKRIKEEKEPILLTQHGKSAVVLLEVSEYEKLIDKSDLLDQLLEQSDDLNEEKSEEKVTARSKIEEYLSKWRS